MQTHWVICAFEGQCSSVSYTHISAYTHTYTRTYTYLHAHAHMKAPTYTHKHIHRCINTLAYRHAGTHTYMEQRCLCSILGWTVVTERERPSGQDQVLEENYRQDDGRDT